MVISVTELNFYSISKTIFSCFPLYNVNSFTLDNKCTLALLTNLMLRYDLYSKSSIVTPTLVLNIWKEEKRLSAFRTPLIVLWQGDQEPMLSADPCFWIQQSPNPWGLLWTVLAKHSGVWINIHFHTCHSLVVIPWMNTGFWGPQRSCKIADYQSSWSLRAKSTPWIRAAIICWCTSFPAQAAFTQIR